MTISQYSLRGFLCGVPSAHPIGTAGWSPQLRKTRTRLCPSASSDPLARSPPPSSLCLACAYITYCLPLWSPWSSTFIFLGAWRAHTSAIVYRAFSLVGSTASFFVPGVHMVFQPSGTMRYLGHHEHAPGVRMVFQSSWTIGTPAFMNKL